MSVAEDQDIHSGANPAIVAFDNTEHHWGIYGELCQKRSVGQRYSLPRLGPDDLVVEGCVYILEVVLGLKKS